MRTYAFLILAFVTAYPPVVSGQTPGEPDEVVRQLESRASRGGDELGTSIRRLAKIGAWKAADRWVASINRLDDQDQLARTASLIGADMLLKISLQESLSENSQTAINKMNAASKAVRESPALMQQAIRLLDGNGVDDQLNAARTLRAGGNAAIKAMVDQLAQGPRASTRTKLLTILSEMGDAGAEALDQLALYGDDSARYNALVALSNSDAALATLVSTAFASDASQKEQALARRVVGRSYADINPRQAITFLTEQLRNAMRTAARTANNDVPATVWSLGTDRSSVMPSRSQAIYLAYRNAYDAARRLSRQSGISSEALRLAMVADLNYRVIVDVDWGDADQLSSFRNTYGDALSPQPLGESLAQARRDRHVPAALGLIRVAESIAKDSPEQTSALLASGDGAPSALAEAVGDAEPRVRFEAARVLDSVGPDHFAGSSQVRKTLAEMSRLPDRPRAILIETRPFIALSQESILGRLGFEVRTVDSAMSAEREISSGGDIGMVVSKLRLADMRATELVDRIRRLPRGSEIGIVFFDDGDASEKTVQLAALETTAGRWKGENFPRVRVVPLPGDPAALGEVLLEMDSQRRLPTLTLADRRSFRYAGIAALAQ